MYSNLAIKLNLTIVPEFHQSSNEDDTFDPLDDPDDNADDLLIIKRASDPDEPEPTLKSRPKTTSIAPRNYNFCYHEGCDKKYANVNHLKVCQC